jgi:hypothetical protein
MVFMSAEEGRAASFRVCDLKEGSTGMCVCAI